MKKIIVFLIGFFLLISAIGMILLKKADDAQNANESTAQVQSVSTEFKYIQNPTKTVYLMEFSKPLEVYFDGQNQKTVRDTAKDNSYKIAINGGYFTPDKSYAGLLQINGVVLAPLSTLDKQVTGVVVLDADNISFLNVTDFNPGIFSDNKNFTLFQSGPIFISQNKINEDSINGSVNGNEEHVRSFLGYTNSGQKFIGISTDSFTLKKLAEEILKLPELKSEIINVINLDGGSSTFIYSTENKEFNIGTFKTLPVILGVK